MKTFSTWVWGLTAAAAGIGFVANVCFAFTPPPHTVAGLVFLAIYWCAAARCNLVRKGIEE